MRVLFLHVDYLEYEVTGKALKSIGEIPQERKHGRVEEALVCFLSAEKRDEKDPKAAALAAAKNIEDVAGQLHTKRIALYPYAHLSSDLAAPEPAQAVLAALEAELGKRGYDVHASPFGYYKSFRVSVKGHPLSELSREIVAEATPAVAEEPAGLVAFGGLSLRAETPHRMRVAGRTLAGTPREIRDPASGRAIGRVEEGDAASAHVALDAASAARMPPADKRAAILERAADGIEAHRVELMALLVREAGRTLPDALGEVREAADFCRYYALAARRDHAAVALEQRVRLQVGREVARRREAVGLHVRGVHDQQPRGLSRLRREPRLGAGARAGAAPGLAFCGERERVGAEPPRPPARAPRRA